MGTYSGEDAVNPTCALAPGSQRIGERITLPR
jgi:hypothetical protein